MKQNSLMMTNGVTMIKYECPTSRRYLFLGGKNMTFKKLFQ